MTRKLWIGGNWKCNGTKDSIIQLAQTFNKLEYNTNLAEVVIFPPSLYASFSRSLLDPEKFQVGVQNVSQLKEGAFTGELSTGMLHDVGLTWTLLGHSERRAQFNETNEVVAKRVEALQDSNIKLAVCIGEDLKEREDGVFLDVVTKQLEAFVDKVKNWDNVVVAYEPVWAIGTGKVATPEQVSEMHKAIRDYLQWKIGEKGNDVRIVYGGSVNDSNCVELIDCDNVDGFLVGGTSLKPSFCKVVTLSQR